MTTKHTPGPWVIHTNIGRKGEMGIVTDASPCIVAIMGNAKEWPVEARANALLICAAPDLLAAAKVLMSELQSRFGYVEATPEESSALCLMEAAIAKAEGSL